MSTDSDTEPDPSADPSGRDATDGSQRTASIHLARPGDQLPGTPYRLIERLGGGGMGQVFRAEHIELGREVAVKLLAPALAHDPKAMERLRREARAAARLGNPHIIDVYDLGITDDGRPYVVMKLIPGRDLKVVADEEAPLAPARVVDFVRQIGDALKAAHAAGVVHRDLKPENVLVEVRGESEALTILDFGIAQSIQDTDTRLTRDGQMIGTPGYMAPEQALARALDGRADQYALAVMTYELLAGRSPFDRLSPLQLIAAQLTEEPAPLGDVVDRSRVPMEMVAVVMRGMARDPGDRYPEVAGFVEALTEAARRPIGPPPAPAPTRRGAAGVMVGLAALVIGVVVAFALIGTGGPDPDRPPPPAPSGEPTLGAVGGPQAPESPPTPIDPAPAPDRALGAPPATPDAAAAAPDAATPAPRAVAPEPEPRAKPKPAPEPKPVPKPAPEPKRPSPPAQPEPAQPEPAQPEPAQPEPAQPEPTPPNPTPAVAAVAATPDPEPPPPPPPAEPPVLTFGGLDVVGGASTRQIRRTVSDGFPRIKACVAGKSGLNAGRRATVRFVIDADGFFGGFGGEGDPALVECGTRVLRRINRLTRRPDTGDIRVALPMRLEAP